MSVLEVVIESVSITAFAAFAAFNSSTILLLTMLEEQGIG
jgi:hypothetical protein